MILLLILFVFKHDDLQGAAKAPVIARRDSSRVVRVPVVARLLWREANGL